MPTTVTQVENELAGLLGAGSREELAPEDATLLRSLVQECLTACFIPDSGSRPNWATRYASAYFPAPQSATLTLTQGSKDVVGAPAGALPGARVFIDDTFYTYAGNGKLVGEWTKTSGDYDSKFYYNQVAIPNDAASIEDTPIALGIGELYPLAGLEEEMLLRTYYNADFRPFSSQYQALGVPRRTHIRSRTFEIGQPWFYWLDSTAINPFEYPTPVGGDSIIETESSEYVSRDGILLTGDVPVFYLGQRLSVYPLPDEAITVEYRINVNPQITGDDMAISLPAEVVAGCFLPLCREAVAQTFPDYRGRNIQELKSRANQARMKLKKLASPQRRGGGTIQPANGW